MSAILQYIPGQTVSFYQETENSQHQLVDTGIAPIVTRVIYPDFIAVAGYPQNMTRVDVGLYYFQFVLPKEHKHHDGYCWYLRHEYYKSCSCSCPPSPVLGTYFVDITYIDPDTLLMVSDSRQIIVTPVIGTFGVTAPMGVRAW